MDYFGFGARRPASPAGVEGDDFMADAEMMDGDDFLAEAEVMDVPDDELEGSVPVQPAPEQPEQSVRVNLPPEFVGAGLVEDYNPADPRPADPNTALVEPPSAAETPYWQQLDDLVFRVGALVQTQPRRADSPWDAVAEANGALARAVRERNTEEVDNLLVGVLGSLQLVGRASPDAMREMRDIRAQICNLVPVAPTDLCSDDTAPLDAIMERVLGYLGGTDFDRHSTRPVRAWREQYAAATGPIARSAVITDLANHLWAMQERWGDDDLGLGNVPQDAQIAVGRALAILCNAVPDSRCARIAAVPLPVQVPEGAVDLNALYKDKCTGRAPWAGSLLCNLGKGGPTGYIVNSVRIVPNDEGGYSSDSSVVWLLGLLEYMDSQIARVPGARWLPLVGRLQDMTNRLRERVRRGEVVAVDDLDSIMAAARYLLESSLVRSSLGWYMRKYQNIEVLPPDTAL